MFQKILISVSRSLHRSPRTASAELRSPFRGQAGIGRLARVDVRDLDGARDRAGAGERGITSTCPLSLRFAPLLGRLSRSDLEQGVR